MAQACAISEAEATAAAASAPELMPVLAPATSPEISPEPAPAPSPLLAGTPPAPPPAIGKAYPSDVTGDGPGAPLATMLRASEGNGASCAIRELRNDTRNRGDSIDAGVLLLSQYKLALLGDSFGSGSCDRFQCGPLMTE